MEIDIPIIKDQIAIVVVGYNRLKSITRLLNSLLNAYYPDTSIPLIISIDCSGDNSLYQYVNEFNWPYGEKYVNIQKKRLGLKEHIYQCGDLTKFFKAIVLFEDDLFVSPYFYDYVQKTVDFYGDDERIAEISLYKNEYAGFAKMPFQNVQDGVDVFLKQDVSTWGQCWTETMWDSFKLWRDTHTEEDIKKVDMPEKIKRWERAWSKYYLAYVVDTGRHVLFPNVSLTTNFSDAGEHGGTQNSVVQVSLLQGDKKYNLKEVSQLTSYDIYNNNESIYDWLQLSREELCLDLYGNHYDTPKRYLLSTRLFSYKLVNSFALHMRPIELNIKYKVNGEGIYLYDTTNGEVGKKKFSEYFVPYMLGLFKLSLLKEYVVRNYYKMIKTKFLKLFK